MSDDFYFPLHTIRPHLVIALIIILSILMDIYYLNFITPKAATLSRVLIGYTSASKLIGLYKLIISRQDARKYLIRRIRLFGVPLQLPHRIMRDVRARILAIGILQLVATFAYFILLFVAITVFSYNVFMVKPWRGVVSLTMFLLIKCCSSLAVFIGVLYDSDVVLTLAYFGCFGFHMSYFRDYVRNIKKHLGGWPYPYYFNELRFKFLTIAKCIDVLIGLIGFAIIFSMLGGKINNMESNLKAYIGVALFVLVVTDIWCPILFRGVFWLINKQEKLYKEDHIYDDSDDSELDDFGIRQLSNKKHNKGSESDNDSSDSSDSISSGEYTALNKSYNSQNSSKPDDMFDTSFINNEVQNNQFISTRRESTKIINRNYNINNDENIYETSFINNDINNKNDGDMFETSFLSGHSSDNNANTKQCENNSKNNQENNQEINVFYDDSYPYDEDIIVPKNADDFIYRWNLLSIAAEFSCVVIFPNEIELSNIVKSHLQNSFFHVIDNIQLDRKFNNTFGYICVDIYAIATALDSRLQDCSSSNTSSSLFLVHLKFVLKESTADQWILTLKAKVTIDDHVKSFISLLNLGTILTLLPAV
jgi:hypothetical protein